LSKELLQFVFYFNNQPAVWLVLLYNKKNQAQDYFPYQLNIDAQW